MTPLRNGAVRALVAALSAAVLVLSFPPIGWWWLAPVAVALFTLSVRGRSLRMGALLGLVFGAVFFLGLLRWAGTYVGPVWLFLVLGETAFMAALGAATAWASRIRFWPLPVAALWVAEEALRDRQPFGGFPWGRLAFSQPDSPVLALARLGGAPLVTFAVALSGSVLALGMVCWWRRRPVTGTLAVLGAAAIVVSGLVVPRTATNGPSIRVAVIQGNVPRLGLEFNAQREAVLRNHVAATFDLAKRIDAGTAARPDLVVWPENASDIDPLKDRSAGELIQSAVDAVGAPVLVGAILDGPGQYRSNVGIVWNPGTGPAGRYVKRHPVPFAEYIPLRSIARRVSDKVALVPHDMYAGTRRGDLAMGPTIVGDVICFEVADDWLVNDVVRGGAQIVVVQTNNATFGRTGEAAQQLAMSQLRAVEQSRTVLSASTSGISAIITPDGAVHDPTSVFTAATLTRTVPLSTAKTLATRLGSLPEWILTALGVGGALLGGVRGRRRRVRG